MHLNGKMTRRMGNRGIISIDTTQTDQLLNKQTKITSGKMQQNVEVVGKELRGTTTPDKWGKRRELSMSRFYLDKNATEKPIKTRVRKTDTC